MCLCGSVKHTTVPVLTKGILLATEEKNATEMCALCEEQQAQVELCVHGPSYARMCKWIV